MNFFKCLLPKRNIPVKLLQNKFLLSNFSLLMNMDVADETSCKLDGVSTELPFAPDRTGSQSSKCTEQQLQVQYISNPDEVVLSRREKRRMWRRKAKSEKVQRKPKARNLNPGCDVQCFQETEYYFENGLRKVFPYNFTYTTYVKRRWLERTIDDVFLNEFQTPSREYVLNAISTGTVTVNSKAVDLEYKLKDNDILSHTVHRHELPVTGDPIEVIECNEDLVVLNKPSSIPVHPCGRYRHNSVSFILGKEHGLNNLRTIYRLDRLTSGVLLLGRSYEKTRELMQQVANRELQKEYVCRVEGEFPSERQECKEPIGQFYPRMGVWQVMADGKESHTVFERLSYNGRSSVVKCIPYTGRTHQIRLHLQYLGYPIINDFVYNSTVWGTNKGKGGDYGLSKEQIITNLQKSSNTFLIGETEFDPTEHFKIDAKSESTCERVSPHVENNSSTTGCTDLDREDSSTVSNISIKQSSCDTTARVEPIVKKPKLDKEENSGDVLNQPVNNTKPSSSVNKDCLECRRLYKDPTPEELVLYLHALKYKGPGWEYSTAMPYWAEESWHEKS